MKITCEVIKDLLPLYVEKITSKDSDQLIQEHLEGCHECSVYEKDLRKEIKMDMGEINSLPLKSLQKEIGKRKRDAVIFISLIVSLVMLCSFSYITKPHFLSKEESGVTIEEVENNKLYINFSNKVTSCKITRETWEGGEKIVTVNAWTSILDDILGKTTPSLSITNVSETVDTIYYSSNDSENESKSNTDNNSDNMTIIYGTDPIPSGGVVVLPRLVLGYYFYFAILLAVFLGIFWILLKKWKKAREICIHLLFVPISYIIAQIVLGISFVSFTVEHDFIMMILAAVMIYGIEISGRRIFLRFRRDKQLEGSKGRN